MALLEIVSGEDLRRLEDKLDRLYEEVRGLRRQLAASEPPLSPAEFSRRYPEWTKGRLGQALFKRHENGLSAAVHQERPGGRILIDAERFFAIVLEWAS